MRVRRRLDLLVEPELNKALADPEFFATSIDDARDIVKAHVQALSLSSPGSSPTVSLLGGLAGTGSDDAG